MAFRRLAVQRDGGLDGWFLVRQSTKEANTFVVSLCVQGKLFHNQVCWLWARSGASRAKEPGQCQSSLARLALRVTR
jgi:hypothetical protein